MKSFESKYGSCGMYYTMSIVEGKWKWIILWEIYKITSENAPNEKELMKFNGFNYSIILSPHFFNSIKILSKFLPFSVNSYSTFGGICG